MDPRLSRRLVASKSDGDGSQTKADPHREAVTDISRGFREPASDTYDITSGPIAKIELPFHMGWTPHGHWMDFR